MAFAIAEVGLSRSDLDLITPEEVEKIRKRGIVLAGQVGKITPLPL